MRRLFLLLIRFYQRNISSRTPPSCRFFPTCSQYAYEAIAAYGVILGTLMGMWRLLRCGPWTRGGYDPVPLSINLFGFVIKARIAQNPTEEDDDSVDS
jgi:putative membrane protein insertion efficiency factor